MGRPWSDAEIAELARRYPHERALAIAEDLGRSLRSVYQKALKLGLNKSPELLRDNGKLLQAHPNCSRFSIGNEPWNKGIKWSAGGRSRETQFKPGNKPHTHRPIGSERETKDGILIRKISDTGNKKTDWRPVHVLEWERHNGPLSSGHVVIFKNGDRRDFTRQNLIKVTRAELMRMNSRHTRYPPELNDVMQLRGVLKRKINEVIRNEKQS